jgi:uracil phosphoribosyltransferase
MPPADAARFPTLHVVQHPLVEHKMTLMRERTTPVAQFRQLTREVAMLLAYEVTRDLALDEVDVETPLMATRARKLSGKKLCIVSILRAGNGMLEAMLDLIPSARVGHVGLYRDPKTLIPIEYYYKMPQDIDVREVIIVDPMLATANSAVAAVDRVKEDAPPNIRFVCLLAAPEGVERFADAHPDVPIYTAALDEGLNEKGYILPGLGDAGDRIYGTK